MRKAQFLELDALFAIAILIGGILLLKGLYIHPYEAPQIENTATDAVITLQTRTIGSLGISYINDLQTKLVGTGITIHPNQTIARQLTILLIEAEAPGAQQATLYQAAENLSVTAMQGIIRSGEYYNITVLSADERYTLATSDANVTIATQARTMLSGLQVNKNIFGYTATAYLSDANSQQASYYKFGGFVGQGNITAILELPESPIAFTLEGDFHDNFTISVNGNAPCTSIVIPINPDPLTSITQEDITASCVADLIIGTNLITINFTGSDTDQHYIGGGYLKVTYLSDQVYTSPSSVTKKHALPGIHGIFNLYDAVYIPGQLQSMTINLHYFANHTNSNNTVFFTLGDRILYQDNESIEEQHVTLTDNDLADAGINYNNYENKTVPFRFGYDNGSLELLASSVIDAVLVTDVSGSMGWEFNTSNNGDQVTDCNNPSLYLNETRRLSVAKCADKNFTRLILEDDNQLAGPNRIGLVSYDGSTDDTHELSTNYTSLEEHIDDYSAGGSTCICCGVLDAIERYTADTERDINNENITRAVLIMTDGVAYAHSDCTGILGTSVGDLNNNGNNNDHGDFAVAAACLAKDDYNISIFTVGFGSTQQTDNDTLYYMAACDNESHYHQASNSEALQEIYNEIARDIIQIADYNAQIISFDVEVSDSTIYPDSYIEYTYTPHSLPDLHGKLLIDGERRPFIGTDPCIQTNVNFPLALHPLEGSIISYSGNYWTDYLKVNEDELYNLTTYGPDYQFLGDPFSIGIPPGIINRGPNKFSLRTAESPTQAIDCSPHNKLLYKATLDNTLSLNKIYPEAEGCNWTVDMLGTIINIVLPENYTGPTTCTYETGPTITYDDDDVWQALGYQLFNSFDIDEDGSVDIDFAQHNLDLHLQQQKEIPYLWGPALIEVTVWR